MKIRLVLLITVFKLGLFAQIEIITSNTNSDLRISSVGKNIYIIGGQIPYLAKCYNNCDNIFPLSEPANSSYSSIISRIDTSLSYMLFANYQTSNYKLYKTSNGAASWTKMFDTTSFVDFLQLNFFDSQEGLILGNIYKLFRTKNGGSNWPYESYQFLMITTSRQYSDSIICVGGADIGGNGSFLLSKDRGHNWYTGGIFPGKGTPYDFYFLNKDSIFGISGPGNMGFGPEIGISYNKGLNWNYSVITPTFVTPYGIHVKSKKEIYLVGSSTNGFGFILKSVDLGLNWQYINTGIKSDLRDIVFLNDSVALISGSNGTLFKWNSKSAVFTGLKTNYLDDEWINLYPNPSKATVNVDIKSFKLEKTSLNMFNSIGEKVYSLSDFKQSQEIDISFLASGIYYLKLQSNFDQRVFKIVKE